MDGQRFDELTRAVAMRTSYDRLSRRAVLRGGAAGLAAVLLGAFGLRSTGGAQDASPTAEGTPAEQPVSWISAGKAGEVPSQRGAARMTHVGGELVLFGGFDECFDVATGCEHVFPGDVHHFDLASEQWRRVVPTAVGGVLPAPRAFHSQAAYFLGESVIVYGGVFYTASFSEFVVFDDLWEYLPLREEWRRRSPANAGPGTRVGAGLQIDGDQIYLFGGLSQERVGHNDLWRYDLRTDRWTQLLPDGAAGSPPVRYLGQFELDDRGNRFLLFGGNVTDPLGEGLQFDDTWAYDIAENRWTQIPTPMPGRVHSAATVYEHHFVVVLGDINDDASECVTNEVSTGQKPTNEVWALDLRPTGDGWDQIPAGDSPPPLKRVAFARVNDRLYVWGGFNYLCPEQQQTGRAEWNTEMWILPLAGH